MKKPYTNNTKKIQHIGPVTVQAGQTRECEERDIIAHTGLKKPVAASTPADDPLDLLLAKKVADVQLGLPDLSDNDLLTALEKEKAGAKRKGVLGSIAELQLQRASAANASELEQFITSLGGLSDEELLEQAELYKDKPEAEAFFAAVNTEIETRTGPAE